MGRDFAGHSISCPAPISIHAPAWGATPCKSAPHRFASFQSTRPRGVRRIRSPPTELDTSFQSTRPAWGATWPPWDCGRCPGFQSTRPAWGATFNPLLLIRPQGVSIHAPRVGRDLSRSAMRSQRSSFNPRAPCGARLRDALDDAGFAPFQSTRPVWGATSGCRPSSRRSSFQSTRPVWGATPQLFFLPKEYLISIHAPRVGRDLRENWHRQASTNFNPRAPCGARPLTQNIYKTC